ncbi:hypothetical protein LTR37_003417 [Vermiconidia calcicola]|uniref:Uncharacterized protein n=1 Tax=Vermiconidia calcicola TaxID=1690605 RepID=A0ACC3NQ74_9PEZI|nr:hypothetical protein LTR37_003417 [Vermiconidia calcicola]
MTMRNLLSILAIAAPVTLAQTLTPIDRFSIYEQMSLHQTYIDNDQTCANGHLYADLYWPEASFRVIDPNRDSTVTGHKEIRGNFDYAHSVFPLYMWFHSVGAFKINPAETGPDGELRANAFWQWRVDWKANASGVVSTGTYTDVFEKRGEDWKVLTRVSRDDPNWPLYLFAPYAANADDLFQSSCGDTSLG